MASQATSSEFSTEKSRDKERMRSILQQFSPEQERRYEAYRAGGLGQKALKKILTSKSDHPVGQNVTIVVAGAAKIYAGEVIEMARKVQEEWGEGADPEGLEECPSLRPAHIREAARRIHLAGRSGAPVRTASLL